MSLRLYWPKSLRSIAGILVAIFPVTEVLDQQLETPEIVFTSTDAKPLADKSAQLGNAVAIYEYVRNHFEFAAYHGSRSGSIVTLWDNAVAMSISQRR